MNAYKALRLNPSALACTNQLLAKALSNGKAVDQASAT